MALNKTKLIADILDLYNDESDVDVDPVEARERQAERLAEAIHLYVKSGDVSITVTGTSATGGAVTASGNAGKLN